MSVTRRIKSLFFKDVPDHFDDILRELDDLFIQFMEIKRNEPDKLDEAKIHIYNVEKKFKEHMKILEDALPIHCLLAGKKIDLIKEMINSK